MTLLARLRPVLALTVIAALAGCASVPAPDARDPIESFNRGVFGFNEALDSAVLKPTAQAYHDVAPSWLRKGVGNFFNNLQDVWSAVNNGLQGRGAALGDSVGRVMINTTIGLLGVVDVATDLNIERHTTDFGTTLGHWGVPAGPYVMLPILGPYTLREVGALPVDWNGDLVQQAGNSDTVLGLELTRIVDLRAQYLQAGDLVQGAALDKYTFVRESYLQRQRYRLYDGNPPDDDNGQ